MKKIKHKARTIWKGGGVVFVLAFFLNFFWESIHAVLFYEGHAEYTAGFFTRMILYASFMDALLIMGIFCAGCLFFKRKCWLEHYGRREVLFTIIMGVVIATFIEVRANVLYKWLLYTEIMPTLLGIGLVPLAQFAITGPLSLFLAAKLLYAKK